MRKVIIILAMLLLVGCTKKVNLGEHTIERIEPRESINKISEMKFGIPYYPKELKPTSTPRPTNTPTNSPTPTLMAEQIFVGLTDEELAELNTWINTQYPRFRRRNNDVSIYDAFTTQEIFLLFHIVEAETYGSGYRPKENVASVIFNRLESGWGETLEEVLKQPNQFAVYTPGEYINRFPTQKTIKACESAWKYDTVDNCVYFNRHTTDSYAKHHCEYVFTDEVGHDFYREKEN